MADPLDLTGAWEGIFSYPRSLPPNAFGCVLRDRSGALAGEVQERGDSEQERSVTLIAMIEGRRNGRAVSFTKRYDDLARARYAVDYEGQLSEDGDEITGRWSIPGIWSGTFIMMRSARRGIEAERRVAETVR